MSFTPLTHVVTGFTLVAMTCPGATIHSTILTGGDAGEGFTPGITYVTAVDFYPAANQGDLLVQTALFKPYAAQGLGPTVSYAFPVGSEGPHGDEQPVAINGQSGSDTNLDLIMDRQLTNHWDNSPGPLDLTVSGLVAGENYQVDLLIGNDDDLYGGSWRYSFQEEHV